MKPNEIDRKEEFWIATYESPAYSEETDIFFKKMFNKNEYRHEVLACF